MNESLGFPLTATLVCVFAVAGAILTFNPRLIRGWITRLSSKKALEDEFTMPGAVISMRVIGVTCLALAVIVVAAGHGVLSLF